MIELGRVQELMVVREKNFGVYLGQKKDDAAAVLLPKKQVPEGTKVGDKLKVFIYKDSEDRLIATTSMPKLELGGTAVLKVKDVSKIGAFLDMGLEKDLLLPFKEQVYPVRAGEDRRFLHISRVPQIFCKNTHAVAALLRLAAVRVVDAYIKIILPQIWTRQNAIRADAKMTAAHLLDILRIQFQIILIWIKHQVIISHTVIFFKHNLFHRDTSCPF